MLMHGHIYLTMPMEGSSDHNYS